MANKWWETAQQFVGIPGNPIDDLVRQIGGARGGVNAEDKAAALARAAIKRLFGGDDTPENFGERVGMGRSQKADGARYQGQADAFAAVRGRNADADRLQGLADMYAQMPAPGTGGLKGGAAATKGGGGGGQPSGPDLAAYLQPYSDAEAAARAAHEAAIPSIQGTYADLEGRMGATRDDVAQQLAALEQAAASRGAEGTQQIDSRISSAAEALRAQGLAGPQLEQALAGLQPMAAAQEANTNAQVDTAGRIGDIFNQSADSRISDQALAEAAALGNAENTLSQTLQQIGLGKAEATQQHGADTRAHQMSMAELMMDQQRQAADIAKEQTAQQEELLGKAEETAKQYMRSPRQEFETNYESLATDFPKATKVFEDVLELTGSGKGPRAFRKARDILYTLAPDLTAGKYETLDGQQFTNQFDLPTIEKWLRDFFDDEPKLTADGQAAIQGLLGRQR